MGGMRVIHHACGDSGRGDAPCCVAGTEHGVRGFAVATQTLAPGARGSLPPHGRGERVALALSGCGKLLVDGGAQRFQAPCTLVLPPGADCPVVNHGAVALQLVWVSAAAPHEDLPQPPR